MKRPAAVALALALLAMTASGARAGDKIKVKREYHTPYGKVKVKEYYHRNPAPYYSGPRPSTARRTMRRPPSTRPRPHTTPVLPGDVLQPGAVPVRGAVQGQDRRLKRAGRGGFGGNGGHGAQPSACVLCLSGKCGSRRNTPPGRAHLRPADAVGGGIRDLADVAAGERRDAPQARRAHRGAACTEDFRDPRRLPPSTSTMSAPEKNDPAARAGEKSGGVVTHRRAGRAATHRRACRSRPC